MTRAELVSFMQRQKWAVQASRSADGAPQAAVIGVAIAAEPALELYFDTLSSTRKHANLVADPRIALVIGWDDGQTVQLEGRCDQPGGADLERLLGHYLARFPDGLERKAWPGIAYWRVRPHWLRYSDFRGAAPQVVELDAAALAALT